jgi:HD-like signal output (HDOD) protein
MLKRIAEMLHGLFRSFATPRGDEAAARAARLEKNVLALVGNMPTLPATATRAMRLADDPEANFAELAKVIEGDVAITTGLLRVANSALYGSSNSAMKLSQALLRLGTARAKNLIVSIGMKSLMWKMAGEEKKQCEALWHHGYLTGCLCHVINSAFRLQCHGGEFAAGLLHDLGRILVLLADPDCFELADLMDFREDPGLLQRERAAIGIDHCALGGWFGEHSQLPEPLTLAMRHHHEPEQAEGSSTLVALVATADHMANHLQRGEAPEEYDPEENAGLSCLWARWPEARKERFRQEIPAMMASALKAASGA